MITLTLRYIKGDFVVTGPGASPVQDASRGQETGEWRTTRARPSKRSVRSTSPQCGATSGRWGLKGAHRAPHQFARALRVEPE